MSNMRLWRAQRKVNVIERNAKLSDEEKLKAIKGLYSRYCSKYNIYHDIYSITNDIESFVAEKVLDNKAITYPLPVLTALGSIGVYIALCHKYSIETIDTILNTISLAISSPLIFGITLFLEHLISLILILPNEALNSLSKHAIYNKLQGVLVLLEDKIKEYESKIGKNDNQQEIIEPNAGPALA